MLIFGKNKQVNFGYTRRAQKKLCNQKLYNNFVIHKSYIPRMYTNNISL